MSDKSKAPAKPEKGSRRRRIGVTTLVVLGALCIFISTLERLDSRRRTRRGRLGGTRAPSSCRAKTSATSLSIYHRRPGLRVERRRGSPEEALPEQLKPLAGPLSAQLRGVAYDAVDRALERPRVQELWRSANRAVNAQLVDLLEGNTDRLQLDRRRRRPQPRPDRRRRDRRRRGEGAARRSRGASSRSCSSRPTS